MDGTGIKITDDCKSKYTLAYYDKCLRTISYCVISAVSFNVKYLITEFIRDFYYHFCEFCRGCERTLNCNTVLSLNVGLGHCVSAILLGKRSPRAYIRLTFKCDFQSLKQKQFNSRWLGRWCITVKILGFLLTKTLKRERGFRNRTYFRPLVTCDINWQK